MSYGRIEGEERRLREESRRSLIEAEQTDRAKDKQYGRSKRGDELPTELARREERLKRIDGQRKSRVLGLVKEMTKSKARDEIGKIVAEENKKRQGTNRVCHFGEFVEQVFFPYYSRKWKASTRGSTMNRISIHLVADFKDRKLAGFTRDELQDLLDRKVEKEGLSFSTVDHLRWDLKQVFDMMISEGHIERNPAQLLFTRGTSGSGSIVG